MSERDTQIDALRGLAIMLVVMGHVIAFSHPSDYQDDLLFNLIYSFHMPLFFVITGYLVFDHFSNNTLDWIKKKFMGLVIPYVIFTFFYFYILPGFNLNRITFNNLIIDFFAYTKPDSAWFLPVLFETLVVLAIIINAKKIFRRASFIAFFIIFLGALPLSSITLIPGLSQILYYSPYVVLGYLICVYKEQIARYSSVILIMGSLLFPIIFYLRRTSIYNYLDDIAQQLAVGILPAAGLYSTKLLGYCYAYMVAIAGIITSYLAIRIVSRLRLSSFFALFGIFSMEIYLTHLVILFYSNFWHIPLWFGTGLITIISGTAIVLVIALAISFTLSYNKTLSMLLFGRWSFKYAFKNKRLHP